MVATLLVVVSGWVWQVVLVEVLVCCPRLVRD